MSPSLVSALLPKVLSTSAVLGVSLLLVDCLDTRSEGSERDAGTGGGAPMDAGDGGLEPIAVAVSVDVSAEKAVVAPFHYGMHSSVYDNALHHPELPDLIEESGVRLMRWPGGGYSDNYHWSNHSLTPFANGSPGYLGAGTDFGGFIQVAESAGSAIMITVNYGSNLAGDGPGEPKEAAAWVAYANGDPDDEREIGLDGAGNDWLTVGYWASLRASEPQAEDDGQNFLRIGHPEPLGIEYWEIGNEVFGNGFHQQDMTDGFELDLHVFYCVWDSDAMTCSGTDPACESFSSEDECRGPQRFGNPALSGTAYGEGVVEFVDAMKAVNPEIKVGAVLGTPPADDSWMGAVPDYYWNHDVLAACGEHIDFGIVHWYPNPPAGPQQDDAVENTLFRLAGLLAYPRNVMPVMVSSLRESFTEYAGANAGKLEIVMTEVGTGVEVPRGPRRGCAAGMPGCDLDRGQAMGIFAADMYLTAAELGFVNVDWLELHTNGTFLNQAPADTPHTKGPAFSGIQMAHLLAKPGDRLVTATSDTPSLVAHASVQADGRVGVLLINTQAPELRTARVTVTLDGVEVSGRGERYDYFPILELPEGATHVNAGSGTVSDPEPFSDMQSPFTLDLLPHSVTLLVFDAPN